MAKETDKRWKGLLQNWPTVSEMDIVDYEYKALNQQQVAILLAALSPYRWSTRWIDLGIDKDELEKLISEIELRLMESEDVATVEEICEGVTCAIQNAAEALLTGYLSTKTEAVTINPDGSTTVTPVGTIENDPTTNADEEARAGGAQAVANGINNLITDLTAYYGPNDTEDMPLADAQFLINSRYLTDTALMDAAIAAFWALRATNVMGISSLVVATLTQDLYCDGITIKTALDHISRRAENIAYRKIAINLVSALTQLQIDEWYNRGSKTPSTDYLEFDCTPFDTETIVFSQAGGDLAGSAYKTGSVVNKNNHRVRLNVSGKIVDTVNGGYQDFFWKVTAAGVKTLVTIASADGTFQCNENWDEPTAAEVPFRADGIYNVTRETFATGCTFLSIRRKMTNPAAGGSFTMTITDLGEVIS